MENNQFQELKVSRNSNECLLVWMLILFAMLFFGMFLTVTNIHSHFRNITTKLELIEFKIDDINRQKTLNEIDEILKTIHIG